MHFVDLTNSVEIRTVSAVTSISATDISIARLDSALPTNRFTPARILAPTFTNYLPMSFSAAKHIPAVTLDREEKVSCRDFNYHDSSCYYGIPEITNRYAYYDTADGGDSGSPTFLITSNEAPVILSCWWTATAGPSLSRYASTIQTVIYGLGGTATNLSYVDLSAYNTY
jgi:hypothetical protein